MLDLNDSVVNELKKLTKPAFNVEQLINTAGELKYMREIKKLLAEQMENPADELRRVFRFYEGEKAEGKSGEGSEKSAAEGGAG